MIPSVKSGESLLLSNNFISYTILLHIQADMNHVIIYSKQIITFNSAFSDISVTECAITSSLLLLASVYLQVTP